MNKSLHKNIKLLSWFNFCTDFVFFAPVAIIYFAKVTGSITLGMSIFSVAYVSSALFEIPTGIISDLIGRRSTAILGATCSVMCVVLYAIGTNYWIMFLGGMFQGLSRSFYSGNNEALLYDTLNESGQENEYHTYLGRTSSMLQVALAISSLVGGIMASFSFELVVWASVFPQIGALLLTTQLIEPSIHSAKEQPNIYKHLNEAINQFKQNYKLRLLTIASVMRFSLGESAFFLRAAFVNSLWPLWAVGMAQMISNVSAAISFYFSGKIIDRFGTLKVLNFEIISNRIVNLFALLFPTVISPVLMGSTSITYGAGTVATSSLLQQEFSIKQRATMGSLNSLGGSVVFGIFSVLLGAIADTTSVATALIIAHILLMTPLIFYRKVFNHDQSQI